MPDSQPIGLGFLPGESNSLSNTNVDTLPETNSSPLENRPKRPKRKQQKIFQRIPFSGAMPLPCWLRFRECKPTHKASTNLAPKSMDSLIGCRQGNQEAWRILGRFVDEEPWSSKGYDCGGWLDGWVGFTMFSIIFPGQIITTFPAGNGHPKWWVCKGSVPKMPLIQV